MIRSDKIAVKLNATEIHNLSNFILVSSEASFVKTI